MARSRSGTEYRGCYVPARAPAVKERDWMAIITRAAGLLGWTCYHTFNSQRSAPGFPDLVCLRDGRLLVIETKTERGKVTPAQARWLELFGQVPGVVAMVARPSDWRKVKQVLGAKA